MLVDFICANADVFSWKPPNMLGILWEITEHSLNIRLGPNPVKLCLRRFDEEKRRAIGEKISKLLTDGFIKEVFHPDWLANVVLVKK